MPSTLNNSYDALVIAFEQSKQSQTTVFERELKQRFEKQRILYMKNETMSGEQLFQSVFDKMNAGEIYLPVSQRIVLCIYMDLAEIDGAYLEKYRTFMQEFRDKAGALSRTQHHYLTFFRYRSGSKLKVSMEELVEILNSMWVVENPMPMEHTEYLVYAGGFNNFDNQEKGMVRLLKNLSVGEWQGLYDTSKCKEALHILAFDEYCEKKALILQQQLNEIHDWLYKVGDPQLDNFYINIQTCAQAMIETYSKEIKGFDRLTGLYPVSVREFTPHGIGPFKKYTKQQGGNRELERQREEYRNTAIKAFENGPEQKKMFASFEEQLCYSDYKKIREVNEENGIEKRVNGIVENCGSRLSAEEKEQFSSMICSWIQAYLKQKLSDLETIRKEKEEEKSRCEYEQSLSTKYLNLLSCFDRIAKETKYQILPAIPPATLITNTYISMEVANAWTMKGYHIAEVADNAAMIDDTIAPMEIQHLRIGKYLSLNTPETLNNFKMVIH